MHGRSQRKFAREIVPSAASPEHGTDRVHDDAHEPATWAARPGGCQQKSCHNASLGVSQQSCVSVGRARKLRTGGGGPHGAISKASDTPETLAIPVGQPATKSNSAVMKRALTATILKLTNGSF